MNATSTFGAPWCGLLKGTTAFLVVLFLSFVATGFFMPGFLRPLFFIVPLFALLSASLFMVRGYRVRRGQIEIERLGWSSRVPLDSLQSASADPTAMRWSLRLAGNGGFFVFAGWFWNRRLGRFRAFATDPKRSVVLTFPRRTIVVTPDEPARFVEEIRKTAEGGK